MAKAESLGCKDFQGRREASGLGLGEDLWVSGSGYSRHVGECILVACPEAPNGTSSLKLLM